MMTSENPINIPVRLSFSDFLHAHRLHRATVEHNVHLIVGFILLLLAGFAAVFQLVLPAIMTSDNPPISPTLVIFQFLVGLAAILDLIPIPVLWFRFRQYVRHYPEGYQLIFEDNGINLQKQETNVTCDWRFFREACEGHSVFILTYGKDSYFTIPKSSFQTENEIEVFRNMLKNKLASFKNLKEKRAT